MRSKLLRILYLYGTYTHYPLVPFSPFAFSVLADALESLKQSCEFVCPNDGFLEQVMLRNYVKLIYLYFEAYHCGCMLLVFEEFLFYPPLQLKMFEEMDYKVDHASTIYKRFRLKVLGTSPSLNILI